MILAADEIVIPFVGEPVVLRPSLRTAVRLERRHGLPRLLSAVQEGNLTILAEIIREGSTSFSTIPGWLDDIAEGGGLRKGLELIQEPCFRFVLALYGIDEDKAPEPVATGERVTFDEFHASLFQVATGWLGWTPEVAWDATPAEIIEARAGRVEMLKAIFGRSDTPADDEPAPFDDARDPNATSVLSMLAGQRVGGAA